MHICKYTLLHMYICMQQNFKTVQIKLISYKHNQNYLSDIYSMLHFKGILTFVKGLNGSLCLLLTTTNHLMPWVNMNVYNIVDKYNFKKPSINENDLLM